MVKFIIITQTNYSQERIIKTDSIRVIYGDSNGNNSYTVEYNNDDWMEIDKSCYAKLQKILLKDDEIKDLKNKIEELENAIKYLPMISQEYKNAEEDFENKV